MVGQRKVDKSPGAGQLFGSCLALVLFFFCLLLAPTLSLAIEIRPDQVLVLTNCNARSSIALARYYMEQRGIPEKNLVKLWAVDDEQTSREDYDRQIARPVRRFLAENDPERQIQVLVTMYGLPLRVASPRSPDEPVPVPDGVLNAGASVDSELSILLVPEVGRPLTGWLDNPYYKGFRNKKGMVNVKDVLWVSRLDGPDEVVVRRIIDDTLVAEAQGVTGKAYFDARWPRPEKRNKLAPYNFYDNALHEAGLDLAQAGLQVVLDQQTQLFQPGQAPEAALYCGWYSVGRYVDAFAWQPGAVAYHIASSECTTLKRPGSQVWCKRLLEEGVAATIGPVAEPYVQAFPVPSLFFNFLVRQRLSLVESYFRSLPFLSWQMVLIGDPLYRPVY